MKSTQVMRSHTDGDAIRTILDAKRPEDKPSGLYMHGASCETRTHDPRFTSPPESSANWTNAVSARFAKQLIYLRFSSLC